MKSYSQNRIKIILLFFLLGIYSLLQAQDTTHLVKGIIRNSTNYEPISFALVKNEMLKIKIISDEQGLYIIPFNQGDLLKITAIGYKDGFYIVNDTSEILTDFPIQLKPRIYELDEFTLTPYKTVLQFKHAFTQLDLPENNLAPEINLPFIKHHLPDENEEITGGVSFTSPISALYNTFSHKGKMQKKYRLLMANDYKSKLVEKRFNKTRVARIVPTILNEDLDDFIEFCQFDFGFLLNASDYELIAAVQKKYTEYLGTKFL
ncbi:MAG: hypothetical protein J7J72_06215 [Bacteroidales bacterium]|nr:hypothetical protein [Bacteroidales bacterium]